MHTTNRSNSTEQDGQLLLQPDPLLSYCFLNAIRSAESSCSIIQLDLEDVSTLCLASLKHIKVDAQDQSYYPSRNTSPIALLFPTSGRSNNDEMDCKEAARVITSLRSKVDPEAL